MRLTTSLLAAAVAGAGLSAQTPNEFDLYSGSTSFTSRHSGAGSDEVWVTTKYPARHLHGLTQIDDGAGGSVSDVAQIRYVIQDQGGTTQEPFSVGIFADDAAMPGQPDPMVDPVTSRPAPPFEAGPFNTPTSTNTGAVAWIFTTTLATPYAGFDLTGDNYLGILLAPNAAWTGDGVSIHGSWYTAGNAGDNPSTGALTGGPMGGSVIFDAVHGINITNANSVSASPNDRFPRVWMRTNGTVMRVGADIANNSRSGTNPNYGIGGLYPDHFARQDGLAYKVVDYNYDNTAGGAALVAFSPVAAGSPAFFNAGFQVIPGAANQWFDFTTAPIIFPIGAGANANEWESIVIGAGSTPATALGTITSQAICVDFTAGDLNPRWSNATAIESL